MPFANCCSFDCVVPRFHACRVGTPHIVRGLGLLPLLLLLLLLLSFFLGFLFLTASGGSAGYSANARARTCVAGDGSNGRSTCGAFGGALDSRSLSGLGRVLALLSGLRVLAPSRLLNLSGVEPFSLILKLLILQLLFLVIGVTLQGTPHLALACRGLIRRGLRRRRWLLLRQ